MDREKALQSLQAALLEAVKTGNRDQQQMLEQEIKQLQIKKDDQA